MHNIERSDDSDLDLLLTLTRIAPPDEQDVRSLTLRIAHLLFASTHTTTMFLTHVLYDIASRPEYIKPLSQEISDVCNLEDPDRSTIDHLVQMDSFLKESARFSRVPSLSMRRKVVQPFRFKDGTKLPVGAYVSVPSYGIHADEEFYRDPLTFDGMRFLEGEDGKRVPFVQISNSFMAFGRGKHACVRNIS
ncbi:hypothetical protein MPER_07335 [Moniliophthora perniciosa FA553]|nr:hypothetical protein MPER_07335 [Moniliophthora perniciosa FA553]